MSLQRAVSVIQTAAKHHVVSLNCRCKRYRSACSLSVINCFAVTLVLGTVSGCSFFGKAPQLTALPPPVAVVPSKLTALTPFAEVALSAARSQVTLAAASETLWPRTVTLLKQAEAAAAQFDSPLTIALADEVSALCAVSVKQPTYAPISWQTSQ